MKNPLVSIITPCYNGEKFLDRYFFSIISQTYRPLELIFVNDGSTDKTEEIALSYCKKLEDSGITFHYIFQENAGQAAALNKGLKIFEGKYLTWPDSDDIMTENSIEKKVNFLEKNKNYSMVRSNGIYFNEKNKTKIKICENAKAEKEDIFIDLLLLETYGCCGCYMVSKDLFLKSYPNRSIYESRCGQNWQILVPCSYFSKCGYIDENLYIIFENQNSHSRKERSAVEEIERIEEFEKVLLNTLKICGEEIEKYSYLVKKRWSREKFYYSLQSRSRKLKFNYYKELMKYDKICIKEKLLFIKHLIL